MENQESEESGWVRLREGAWERRIPYGDTFCLAVHLERALPLGERAVVQVDGRRASFSLLKRQQVLGMSQRSSPRTRWVWFESGHSDSKAAAGWLCLGSRAQKPSPCSPRLPAQLGAGDGAAGDNPSSLQSRADIQIDSTGIFPPCVFIGRPS